MDEDKETQTYIRDNLKKAGDYLLGFAKWVILAFIVGTICGVVGALFYKCIEFVTAFRESFPWMLYFLPVAGLIIVFIYQKAGIRHDRGTNLVIASIYDGEHIQLRVAPLLFVSTVLTHLCGGSSGREGAALQIGGSLGTAVGKALKLPKEDASAMTMCGMSAVFSAIFETPVTAAIFSLEVITVGVFHYGALVPCLITALVASEITTGFQIPVEQFTIPAIPEVNLLNEGRVLILAVLCALLSILFCVCMRHGHRLFEKLMPNPYLRIVAGALVVIGLTLLVGCRDYNGAGMEIVAAAIEKETARPEAFALKLLFTVITLGVGFKGGEIVPSFFVGATFGCVVGPLLGLPAGFSAAIGMISVFCGVVNCPLTAMVLSMELFGTETLIFFALSAAISYVMSGYFGLYSSQKIMYSKIQTKFLNRFTS